MRKSVELIENTRLSCMILMRFYDVGVVENGNCLYVRRFDEFASHAE